jgi:hypothetical protein
VSEQHKTYVRTLTGLSDREGKRISKFALGYVGKLLEMSKGKPEVFLMLLKQVKGQQRARIAKLGLSSLRAASDLGSNFAKEKR